MPVHLLTTRGDLLAVDLFFEQRALGLQARARRSSASASSLSSWRILP